MPRIERVALGGYIYHVINRANARARIFDTDNDYKHFESILEEGKERAHMRILAYCIMPNHWHLILYPRQDGDMIQFMGWITNTHTRRWHVMKETVGGGHLYQGRYKSFLCQNDVYFLALVRYVERNPKRAHLVKRAEQWKWSSLWRRERGNEKQKKFLDPWPVPPPRDYLVSLNNPQSASEEEAIRKSMVKSSPFGSDSWVERMAKRFGLSQTLRPAGRKKNSG